MKSQNEETERTLISMDDIPEEHREEVLEWLKKSKLNLIRFPKSPGGPLKKSTKSTMCLVYTWGWDSMKKKAPRLIKLRDKFNSWNVFAKETSDKTAFLKVKK